MAAKAPLPSPGGPLPLCTESLLAAKLEVAMALSDGMKVIAGDLARVLEVAKEGRYTDGDFLDKLGDLFLRADEYLDLSYREKLDECSTSQLPQ